MSDFCGIKLLERGSGNAYTPPPSTLPRPSGAAAAARVGEGLPRWQRGHGVMTDARWFEGAKLNFAHNLMPPPTDDEVRFARSFPCAFLFVCNAFSSAGSLRYMNVHTGTKSSVCIVVYA